MANVMLKYLKFAQILNRRLSFNSAKYYPGQFFSRSYTNSKIGKSYATAAYKLAVNEDSSIRNNYISSIDNKDIQSVDDALARIDSRIRQNGRIQMKNISMIFSSLTTKEETSATHALYLLRASKYCIDEPPSNRIKMVNEIWNRYQELGIEFDVRHYNAMLDVHIKNRLDFNPVDILASMEDMKIEPNKATYMLIMKKYCQDGNISGASEMLEYMKEKQMAVDENVFNYLIEAHINNNDIAGAKEMVEVMRSSNLEPTVDTHAVLACGYAISGDKEQMMSHLKECKGIDNVQNILKVIEALASSGNYQHVDEVLSLIQNKEWHQQELINGAVELIHKNHIEIAYKLATASFTPNYNEGVNIFLKQFVKVGGETSEVIRYCEKLRNEGLNPNIYMVAARAYADCSNLSQSVVIFKRMEELGYYVRPSTFWPLFLSVKEHNKPPEDVWPILKTMTEYGIPCDFKTYTEIVYPIFGATKPDEILNGIKQSGQAIGTAADALFVHYCNIAELDYALELTDKFPISISNKFNYENFLRLYQDLSSENTSKYFKILKYVFTEHPDAIKCDVQGKLLTELILQNKRLLEILLEKYEEFTFSEHTLYICEQELNVRNPPRLDILKKIKILCTERENVTKHANLSIEDEDKYIKNLQDKNISCRSFLTKRIFHHIRTKDIVRVQQLLLIFDEMKFEYTPLMLSNLLGLYCAGSYIDKAKESLDKITTDFPNFQLDLPKALDYVTLLIKYERLDESYETLKDFLSKPHFFSNKDVLFRSIKRFNLVLSNTQNAEFVKKMQDLLLVLSKDVGSKKHFLDPAVNIHLLRGDLRSALEEFRNVVKTHHVPACLNLFLKKCINANEKDILQQVIDLTTSCAGKSYALLELAVAFIGTFHTQSAMKVIESLGQETDPTILDNLCAKLVQQNKLNELESLIQITESLNHVDRESLYHHAFKACANINDFQKALHLFERLKEELISPHPETVELLQSLLKRNNQPLPLSLISNSPSEISPLAAEATKSFLEQLEAGNSAAALKELNSLKKGYIRTLPIKTLTDLVDLCLQKKCTHELSLNVHTMTYIFDNVRDVLKPILEKYCEAGDIEKFSQLTSFMPDFSLMNTGFNSYYCRAFINSGKYDALISNMEEHTTQKNKFFSVFAFEHLLKLPECEERIFNLAVKYLDSNFNRPISVIWAHYFTEGKYEKAGELYKKYPINFERVDNIILRRAKQNENVDLAKKYVDFIKEVNVRSRIKERAYGSAADLLVFKGMYDDATNLVMEAERQNLQLHKYYLSTLVTLKSVLEKENKPVPFSISLDTASGFGSGSDSD